MYTWRENIVFEDGRTSSVSTRTVSCHCNEAILVAFSSSNSELTGVFPDFLDLMNITHIVQFNYFSAGPFLPNERGGGEFA